MAVQNPTYGYYQYPNQTTSYQQPSNTQYVPQITNGNIQQESNSQRSGDRIETIVMGVFLILFAIAFFLIGLVAKAYAWQKILGKEVSLLDAFEFDCLIKNNLYQMVIN